ncbi:MAG: 2,3-bisphosphoglycerate-independent phosphoglycerate mutase [Acidaminococcaceae bacterium]
MAKKPVMLMILDGWGIAAASPTNAATSAQTPNLTSLQQNYPQTELLCSGEAVGLPAGQMGNSEVGHLNIGAGRVVYQELTRITKSIKDGDFFTNKAFLTVMAQVKEQKTALHLMGLVSDGGVHSHVEHLVALVQLAKLQGLKEVYIHAFLDGRDVGQASALGYLQELEQALAAIGVGKLATVSGRYYAMDRDQRWPRVAKAYQAMVCHEGARATSALAGVQAAYAAGVTDEFVEPFIILDTAASKIKAKDGIIFFNFRPDRAREMTRAFTDENFAGFTRFPEARPVHFVCMTQYDPTIKATVAFPPTELPDTLGQVLAQAGLNQLRIAETEKYAHVTFFFNGGVETPNPLEERVLIPSPQVATYDLQPEMSAPLVTEQLLALLKTDKYAVIILNFANPDMVGHTGVLTAAIQAMETVDTCVGQIVQAILSLGGVVCITADHGNLEQMQDPVNKQPYTAHTTNKVPFVVVGLEKGRTLHSGKLADIAPTLLELLHLPKPAAMTGSSLLDQK